MREKEQQPDVTRQGRRARAARPADAPCRIGPFRIERELGSGGMGRVHAAVVESPTPVLPAGAVVALKVVHPHLVETPGYLERFRREGRIGQSIRHDNVVRTLDCDSLTVDGQRTDFLVMELVEGQTLHALQAEMGRLPEDLCRHVAHEVAAGLAAIHAAGIVHRDLKPENVLVTRDNVVKVMDLGVARAAVDESRLTQAGTFIGSITYAAPEQLADGETEIDGRADLYSLGVMLYEAATGINPYRDTDWRVVMRRVATETPRRLGSVNPQVSPFLEELVHVLLAKKREERIASARELVSILESGEESPWWIGRARSIRVATHRPLRRVRIPRETALIGRDSEMETLRAAFGKARAGEGQVVLVEGEAGIGKSRLVDEIAALVQREGEDFEFLHGSYPPGGAATASGAFTTAYREHFGADGLAETLGVYLRGTPLLVPAFAALLTNQAPPEGALALTRDALQTCFINATRAIAAERTAVVLIDDLHFAPEAGRALFASLAMAVPGHRILLVGTSRPPADERWMADLVRTVHATRLGVGRLGAKDLAALLRDALGSRRVASELALRIAEKTDGNPFFVFEVLRGLKDGQHLTRGADGAWVTTKRLLEIRIPSSVADMIQGRVGGLGEDERSLLEIAACAGFEFDPALVGDVAGLQRIPLLKSLGAIERRHRLIRGAGRRYVFDHHQVQEHLYAGMTDFVRESYHAAIGESLERMQDAASRDPDALDAALAARLSEQFLKGGQAGRALRYLERALSHLETLWLHAQVEDLAERALAAPGLLAGVPRARVLLRLSDALSNLGRAARLDEVIREAERVADDAGDDELRASVGERAGYTYMLRRRHAEAEAHMGRALEIARRLGNRPLEAKAEMTLGTNSFNQDRRVESRASWQRSQAIGREIGDRKIEGGSTVNLGNVADADEHPLEALEHYERGVALCREAGARLYEAIGTGNSACTLHDLGRFNEARELTERSLELHRSVGDRRGEALELSRLGEHLFASGDVAEARECFLSAQVLAEEIDNRRIQVIAGLQLARVHREAGDEDAARATLVRVVELASSVQDVSGELFARCYLASLPGGDVEAASDGLRTHGAEFRERVRMQLYLLLWDASGDRAHLAEAKRLLDHVVAALPESARETMLANDQPSRAIVAACREHGV